MITWLGKWAKNKCEIHPDFFDIKDSEKNIISRFSFKNDGFENVHRWDGPKFVSDELLTFDSSKSKSGVKNLAKTWSDCIYGVGRYILSKTDAKISDFENSVKWRITDQKDRNKYWINHTDSKKTYIEFIGYWNAPVCIVEESTYYKAGEAQYNIQNGSVIKLK